MTATDADEILIRGVVDVFFAAFASGPGSDDRFAALRSVMLPGAVLVRTAGHEPVAEDLESFIAPRRALLEGGTLANFREWAVEGVVAVAGDLAHWWGRYAKSWESDGVAVEGAGTKSIQLVRTVDGWRISAVAWDDEPNVVGR